MATIYNLSQEDLDHAKKVFKNEYNTSHNNDTLAVVKKINQLKEMQQLFAKESPETENWLQERGYIGVPISLNVLESYQKMIKDIITATKFIKDNSPHEISKSDLEAFTIGVQEFKSELSNLRDLLNEVMDSQPES
ncbi:hypothetical protein TVAG_483860 [Trichomonas vaginalis G3]|uniref:Uncharacterized protein n=1 Tax=Trichomonas vaginalis (strain ATCC PRA-98 / G3) TaxID=412133 RepID=A2EA29_TRIV3|nr:hypothetical protein TVAGG3_0981000 [Trichomonas vaginalis G3]EAY10475.1 hypothetical protein TVAG_483860 [Trichomonas vaginalis G3]KAI5489297.1 hypothetical protein TVAGG3_0981000 [Trichomonas vaginalis G3]|eukprot:XP_001322698.1 hypothetical protein [Trichomonas vaginalis G3]